MSNEPDIHVEFNEILKRQDAINLAKKLLVEYERMGELIDLFLASTASIEDLIIVSRTVPETAPAAARAEDALKDFSKAHRRWKNKTQGTST